MDDDGKDSPPTLPLPLSSTARPTHPLPLLTSVTRFVIRIVFLDVIIVLFVVVSVYRRRPLRFGSLGLGWGRNVFRPNWSSGVEQTTRTEPFAVRNRIQRWDQTPQMVWRVALNENQFDCASGPRLREKTRNLITLQRRVVISVILRAHHTLLRGIKVHRMPRQIGELVVRPGEEEGHVLTRRDPGFPLRSRTFPTSSATQSQIDNMADRGARDTDERQSQTTGKTKQQTREKNFVMSVEDQKGQKRNRKDGDNPF